MSILVPCYNEQSIIKTSIEGMLRLSYSNREVIYINDGSSDKTMEELDALLNLRDCEMKKSNDSLAHAAIKGFYQSSKYPYIYVLDKENGGKADSLNAGILFSTSDLIVTLDADSILSKEALEITNSKFQDRDMIAAGGLVHVLQAANSNAEVPSLTMKIKNILRLQMLEYIKTYYVYKTSLAHLNALYVISGVFGIFKKDVLLKVNGFRKTVGEDMDITLKIHKYMMNNPDKKMISIPEALCYTECPETWKDLFKQRVRWQKSYVDCLFKFKGFLFKTMFRKLVSFFFIVEGLFVNTLGNYIMSIAVLAGILLHPLLIVHIGLLYIGGRLIWNILYSIEAVYISKKHMAHSIKQGKLFSTVILDACFYRFLIAWILMYGTIAYLFNSYSWNKVSRTGKDYQLEEKPQSMSN
ncbi:MAG TPA: glycosyltransferase family 2 protein [Bacillales bacterium]|nr:glycosyltransferase family 2 protein [Bacillales bacterium]